MVDRRSSSRRNMEPPVNLCVNCKGETQSFLVSDSEKTTWADVEAMVLVSFDLGDIQIKYIDEDNEEVSVNSQDEYEEALKIAVKQGGILQMIVYENQQCQPIWSLKASEPVSTTPVWTGKQSLAQCTLVPRSAEPEMQIEEASKMLCNRSPEASPLFQSPDCRVLEVITGQQFCIAHEDGKSRPVSQDNVEQTQAGWIIRNKEQNSTITDVGPPPVPPDWFIRYMDQFKEQVVQETVLKVTEVMKDRVSQSPDWMSDSSSSSAAEPEQTNSEGSLFDWLMACSSCKKRLLGIRYQCSTCTSFSICEPCETGGYDHDPNHLFLKMRRPLEPSAEEPRPPLPFSMDHVKFRKQMHKTFLKAEKQRLRAEKKQRKAEMKELEKQLKLHRRFHRWHSLDSQNPATETSPSSPLVIPMEPCTQFIPTLSAVFVDENLPDGTHLQPGTRFIKHWRMRNTGNVKWNMDTKLKFMWGNLTLASSSRKDAPVPSLLPGQIGVLSVEFVAPALEGTYTSHWRLAHKGEQFGPRVWCSISVDSLPCSDNLDDLEKEMSSIKISSQKDQEEEEYSAPQITGCPDKESLNTASSLLSTHDDREMYIPSVDLLTAQDLLSFELLDINIVQELEHVPHNTPVDMTPCMSPLPHDGPLMEKPGLGQIKEEIDGAVKKSKEDAEETEGEISGTQFVCETVIRSLTLDAAPDYNPPQKKSSPHSSQLASPQSSFSYSKKSDDNIPQKSFSVPCREHPEHFTSTDTQNLENTKYTVTAEVKPDNLNVVEKQISEENPRDEVESQASTDSSEEYIIILPECFDTSKPLGDSMYCSALSESQGDKENYVGCLGDEKAFEESVPIQAHTINDILTTSQTLDTIPLTPEVLAPSPHLRSSQYVPAVFSVVEDVRLEQLMVSNPEPANNNTVTYEAAARPQEDFSTPKVCFDQTRQITRGSIAGGLMKGALSVAASAYRALFVGQQETPVPPCSEDQAEAMMAILIEMGFCNRQLNQRLLRKHNCNLMDVVTELIQINDNDWYSARY